MPWVPPADDGGREPWRERAVREARALTRLDHPNVIGVIDMFEHDGRPWMVFDAAPYRFPYRSLSDLVRNDGPLRPAHAAGVGWHVLAAIRQGHAVGVLHRDVKPDSVLLGPGKARGRMTAAQLAAELEVSPRTVLRDIEALSAAGIPVYAVRGSLGGFELIDGFRSDLPAAASAPGRSPGPGGAAVKRARVRLSPRGRRLAALLGRPPGIRVRRSPHVVAGREDWIEAWVRIDSADLAVLDILALGADAEVIHPLELRAGVREAAARIAALHAGPAGATVPPPKAAVGRVGPGVSYLPFARLRPS